MLSIISRTSCPGVAEPFRDPGGDETGAQPHQGRLIGGGDHHDRAGQSLRTQVVVDELPHLPPPLADQGDHADLRLGAAGDHGEEAGLADAGSREDPHPLASAARSQGVDRADPQRQGLADATAGQRGGRGVVDEHHFGPGSRARTDEGRPPSIGLPESVEDPSAQLRADGDSQGHSRGEHRGVPARRR